MVQRFSNNVAVRQNDRIVDRVKRHSLTGTRQCLGQVRDSTPFAEAMKEAQVFLILRNIQNRTINADIEQLTDILRRFGTVDTYDKLAELCFPSCRGTTLTNPSPTEINVAITLGGEPHPLVTQSGDNLVTQELTVLEADFTIGEGATTFGYSISGFGGLEPSGFGGLEPSGFLGATITELRTTTTENGVLVRLDEHPAHTSEISLTIGGETYTLIGSVGADRFFLVDEGLYNSIASQAGQTVPITISTAPHPEAANINATARASQQARNDYEYLVRYLAPHPRTITFTYEG